MSTTYLNAAGQAPEDVYEPDTVGDGPVAAINGIGYRGADGALLRFAALKYGTAAPNHGYRLFDGRDFSALWCKKGTASYNDGVVIPFGSYSATSSDSHDTGASMTLTLSTDGTWSLSITALHGGSTTGTPRSGNWHKSPETGVGANYEVRFTAAVTVSNDYTGDVAADPTYTPTTGWMPLSAARSISADTGHLIAGGAGSGSVFVKGTYQVDIRKIGGTQIVSSSMSFRLEAIAL